MLRYHGDGQVAEWSNAPVLKFDELSGQKPLKHSTYKGYSPRRTRNTRTLHRFLLAQKSAQQNASINRTEIFAENSGSPDSVTACFRQGAS